MKRLLVMTILEYGARPNNRIHHTVRSLRSRFDEVVLLYRAAPREGGILTRAHNLLPAIQPTVRDGNLSMIEYNPPLNWVEWQDFSHGPARAESKVRRVIRELSNLFGLTRELCFIGFITLVSLIRLRGRSFDVCLVETAWEAIPALLLRKMKRVRFVVLDDNDFGPGYMQSALRRRWEVFLDKACIRSSDLVISAGYMLAGLWERETGRKVVVIPNGVDLRRFQGSVRQVNREAPSLVYVGNLSSSWMDFLVVFGAMSRLIKKYRNLTFHIIGDEGERRFRELREAAEERGVLENVRFLGRVSHQELPEVLSRFNIGLALMPSNLLRKYACPLKVTEYMALGLPVLTTRGVEAEYIVSKYQCGLCIGSDIEEIARAIDMLIEDEELYRGFSENCLKWASELDIEKLSEIRYREMMREIGEDTDGTIH